MSASSSSQAPSPEPQSPTLPDSEKIHIVRPKLGRTTNRVPAPTLCPSLHRRQHSEFLYCGEIILDNEADDQLVFLNVVLKGKQLENVTINQDATHIGESRLA